jgi:hypothetical protein
MFGRKDKDARPEGGRFARESRGTEGDARTATLTAPATERDDRPATTPAPPAPTATGTLAREEMRAIRARQRAEFGGFAWGSAFFGWLVAFGVAALLSGLLAAAGAATGLTETTDQDTIGLAGGIALIAAVSIAYFCGGYVAGRLARFDGARNGFGVWMIGVLMTAALGVLAVVAGSEYNLVDRANLPRLTVGEETATTAGIVAMGAMLLATALAAVIGGKTGERFHRKVDRHVVDG